MMKKMQALNLILAAMLCALTANSALGAIIQNVRIDADSPVLSTLNTKESQNSAGPVTVTNVPFSGGDIRSVTFGSNHAEYSNTTSAVTHADSVTQIATGFAGFDTGLGDIVGVTLNFNFSSTAYNRTDSLEWHGYGSGGNDWPAGGSSNFDFASLVAMRDTSSGDFEWAAERRGAAPRAHCDQSTGTGDIRVSGVGDGDDVYCRDTELSNAFQALSVAVGSEYFEAIEDGDFSLLLKSHIDNWLTDFRDGDDRRYAQARVTTSVTNAYLSVDYAATAVPLPAAAWLFGASALGLVGISKRKKTLPAGRVNTFKAKTLADQ